MRKSINHHMTTGDNVMVKIEPPAGSKAMGSHFATDPDLLPRRMVSSGTQPSPPKSSNMLNTPGRKRKSGATAGTKTPKTLKLADTKSSKGAATTGFNSQLLPRRS